MYEDILRTIIFTRVIDIFQEWAILEEGNKMKEEVMRLILPFQFFVNISFAFAHIYTLKKLTFFLVSPGLYDFF